jgi:hypothetical protein
MPTRTQDRPDDRWVTINGNHVLILDVGGLKRWRVRVRNVAMVGGSCAAPAARVDPMGRIRKRNAGQRLPLSHGKSRIPY